jgi:heme-degrading monooxygenase HmoA
VIFTSHLADTEGYAETAAAMETLAAQQPGYLGIESARGSDGFGITVSYWTDDASARAWKQVTEHRAAQEEGARRFYADYRVRVARVEREYAGPRPHRP